jgi:hypothetical protein
MSESVDANGEWEKYAKLVRYRLDRMERDYETLKERTTTLDSRTQEKISTLDSRLQVLQKITDGKLAEHENKIGNLTVRNLAWAALAGLIPSTALVIWAFVKLSG